MKFIPNFYGYESLGCGYFLNEATGEIFSCKTNSGDYEEKLHLLTCKDDSYIQLHYNGRNVRAHRVIYELYHGKIPKNKMIDHIDGNKRNNRPSNLRCVSHVKNNRNQRTKSTFQGVFWSKCNKSNPWMAQVRHNHKLYHLGYFDNEVDAFESYLKKKIELHGPDSLMCLREKIYNAGLGYLYEHAGELIGRKKC